MMMNDNRPAWAVVTGASSGIGLALAHQFAEHGFGLVIAAEDDGIERAADALRGEGVEVRTARVDLSTPEGVERLADEITALGAPIDARSRSTPG